MSKKQKKSVKNSENEIIVPVKISIGEDAEEHKGDDCEEDHDEEEMGKSFVIKGKNGSGTGYRNDDGTVAIKNWEGDPGELLKKAGFPHMYDPQSDTILMHFGMALSSAPVISNYVEEFATKGFRQEKGAGNAKNNFRPTDDEYQKILPLMGKAFPQDEIKVYYTVSCDGQQDRHCEFLSRRTGNKCAKMGYDQPVLLDHNYYDVSGVFAKIFDGAVSKVEEGVGFEVNHKIYMLDRPYNQKLIDGIESGVCNKLSIGIRLRRKDYHCNVCKAPMISVDSEFRYQWCGHMPGMELKDGTIVTATIEDIIDFMELSLVTVPAQKYAAIKPTTAPKTDKELSSKSFESSFAAAGKSFNESIMGIGLAVDRNSKDAARISANQELTSKGEALVSEEQNAAAASADETAAKAADNAAADQVQAKGETVLSKFVDAVEKLTAGLEKATEAQTKLAESQAKLEAEQSKLSDALVKVAESHSSLAAKHIDLQKNYAEGRTLLQKIGAAHLDLTQKTGIVLEKSNVDIARMAAAAKGMKHHQDAADRAKADADGFYDTVIDQF